MGGEGFKKSRIPTVNIVSIYRSQVPRLRWQKIFDANKDMKTPERLNRFPFNNTLYSQSRDPKKRF